jgi:Tfp pilus assembly protein PilX
MIRRIVQRLIHDEDGIALVMSLAIMVVFAIATTGIILDSTANQRSSYVSDQQRQAFAIAQEGLAYAEGMVYSAAAQHTQPPTGVQDLPTQPVGSGQYYVSVAGDGVTWTMVGSGTVGSITRTVSAQANVPSAVTATQSGVWNYVYSDLQGVACGTTVNGNVTIAVPLLIRGDLCLSGSQAYMGSQLEVGGNLSVTGSAKVGSASQKVGELRIGLTSSSTNTCNGIAPGTGSCDGSHKPIYATSVAEGMDLTPDMPCIGQPASLDSQCAGANDGTWSTLHTVYDTQAGLTKTGCPANLLDNDGTLNNSDTSITSVLLGSTPYDCKIGNANEIAWTPSTRSLYVKGVLYFDGSLTISNNTTYSGQASMYFTGGLNTTGSGTFCGASGTFGGSTCTTAWNPDQDGIIVVAGCWADSTGSSLISSSCVGLGGGTTTQIGVYCTTDYSTGGNSSNMGPVLAHTLSLGGTTQTLIPFHQFPPGTPLNTTTSYLPGSPPTNWSG